MRARPRGLARWTGRIAPGLTAFLTACVVLDNGPTDPFDRRPFVEGVWDIDAVVLSTTCTFVGRELFFARVFQNRELLQFVVDVAGFGDLRYDGVLERDGDFLVSHTTIFPQEGIRDEATVEGSFGFSGRTLSATEREFVTDLLSGRRCSVIWRWRGDRR